MYIGFDFGTLQCRIRFWNRHSAKKNVGNVKQVVPGTLFAPFCLSRRLSNGDRTVIFPGFPRFDLFVAVSEL